MSRDVAVAVVSWNTRGLLERSSERDIGWSSDCVFRCLARRDWSVQRLRAIV